MKTLVVYYSFEGNSALVARRLAKQLEADLLQLRCGNEPGSGVMKYIIGGMEALRGERANLYKIDKDPSAYDFIVIGGPVWAGTMPPALREFVTQHPFENKRTAIFASSASGNASKMLRRLRAMLAGNEVLAELSVKSPLKNKAKTRADIDQFLSEIDRALGHSEDMAIGRADLAADSTVREVTDELAKMVSAEMKKKKK